jgi:hypothetical protein
MKHTFKFFFLLPFIFPTSHAYAGTTNTQVNGGTSTSVSMSTTSSFQINSSATASPGVAASASAILGISSGALNQGVDCSNNCNMSFSSSGTQQSGNANTSGSSSLSGITASNTITPDPSKTSFSTNVDIPSTSDPQAQGTATSGMSSTVGASVQLVNSTFTNTLIQSF